MHEHTEHIEPTDTHHDSAVVVRGVFDHIQSAVELQKALLARELHDELGGLLVGAVMDVSWAEQHLGSPQADLKQKLLRARQTLSAAIDLKRKLIEELRPTLLDNVGLFAALRWHAQAICKRFNVKCTVTLPEDESKFLPEAPIALFRIVQEAFFVAITYQHAATVAFEVAIAGEDLTLTVVAETDASAVRIEPPGSAEHFLTVLEHRAAALGGTFRLSRTATGGVCMTGRFSAGHTLAPATPRELLL